MEDPFLARITVEEIEKNPTFQRWLLRPSWTLHQAVGLIFGREPTDELKRRVDAARRDRRQGSGIHGHLDCYLELEDWLIDAIKMGMISNPKCSSDSPHAFFAAPQEWLGLLDHLRKAGVNLSARIAMARLLLTEDFDEDAPLESSIDTADLPLQEAEKNLVIAVMVSLFRRFPSAPLRWIAALTPVEEVCKLRPNGIPIGLRVDWLREHLREAKELDSRKPHRMTSKEKAELVKCMGALLPGSKAPATEGRRRERLASFGRTGK